MYGGFGIVCHFNQVCLLRQQDATRQSSANESFSFERGKARLCTRGGVFVKQFLGGSLIDCFHDEAEFFVSGFLSRLFSKEQAEFLESRAK